MGTCRWRNRLFFQFKYVFSRLSLILPRLQLVFDYLNNKNCSIKFNFLNFIFFLSQKILFLGRVNTTLLISVTLTSVILFFSKSIIFYEMFNKYCVVLMLVYFLLSMFIFLKNSYKYNRYTSSIQRFWKRSYILFWLIEFFLFIFFFYILLTHFKESNYFLDWKTLMFFNYSISCFFFNQLFLIIGMIIINYFILYFFKFKNNYVSILFLILNVLLLMFFYNEFLKFIYVVNYYYYFYKSKKLLIKKTVTFSFKNDFLLLKTRTNNHYLNLIILIKFWHIVFIYLFYIFVVNSHLSKNLSYDNISSNLQNFIFLLVFHITLYVFFIKSYLVFFFSNIYFWFFVNIELKKLYFVLYELCNLFSLHTFFFENLRRIRNVLLKIKICMTRTLIIAWDSVPSLIFVETFILYSLVFLFSYYFYRYLWSHYLIDNKWVFLILVTPITVASVKKISLRSLKSLAYFLLFWFFFFSMVWGKNRVFYYNYSTFVVVTLSLFFSKFFKEVYYVNYFAKNVTARSFFEYALIQIYLFIEEFAEYYYFSMRNVNIIVKLSFFLNNWFIYFLTLIINFKINLVDVNLKKFYLVYFIDSIRFFFKKYIYTVNHKRIALNYLYFCFFSAMSGLFLATIIRIELSIPGSFFFKGDSTKYLQVITSHGLIMVFFVVTPVLFGFLGNFFIPYHVGSKDVAFPRLNSFGFWILFCGFIVLAKPASLRRQMFKYYDNSELYKFFKKFVLKKKHETKIFFNKDENKFEKNLSYRLLNNDNDTLWSFFFNENILKKSHTTFVVQCNNASLTMTGWTFITPFSSKTKFTGFGAQDIATIAVIFAGVSTTISFTNLLITRRTLSMPGIRNRKLLIPFISINLFLTMRMLSLIIPVLGAAMIMLQLDRHFGFSFFDYSYGGDPVLFHHLFWFFGHPEVYVVIIPSFGIINMVLPYFNFRRVAAKNHLIWATYIMAYMGFLVWGHHMYLIGLDHRSRSMYSTITVMISLPAVVKIVNWTLTLLNGALSLETPIIFSFIFILFFLCGGLTGMWLSHVGLNVYVHDTFYIVAHFHFMFSAATFSAIFTCIYYYFWQIFSIKYSEYFSYLHAFYWFCGQWLTFLPIFWIGYNGCPRRYHDYPIIFAGWNSLASYGHIITVISVILFFFMIFDSFLIRNEFSQFNLNIPRWHKRINYYIFKISYIKRNQTSLSSKVFRFNY